METPDTGSLEGDLGILLHNAANALRGEPGRVLRGLAGEFFKSPSSPS